jgi:uncharacterized LabA/DUF88 family protein
MAIELGRLDRISLREAWQSEASDFTPWLAQEENLKLLGETLGLDLELEATEQNVGPFRADTDSAMIIDAMDLLYTNNFDGFCLVSSDSDFTRLASRIRESGLLVYGFGEQKNAHSFCFSM